jgi:L-methionine (R)-S-oxide reductase
MNDSILSDLNTALTTILQHFNCVTGTIHLLDPSTGLLQLKAQRGIPEALLPKVSAIPIGKGMGGIAAERRAPVQVCNLQTDDSGLVRPAARETHMQGSIAIPLLLDGQLLGVLGIAKPTAYEFTPKEVADLEGAALVLCHRITPEKP